MFKRIAAALSPTAFSPPTRTEGKPPSSNGASSFHLMWDVPPQPLAEAQVTIEVIEPPQVDALYFWAMQVGFMAGNQRQGGAHVGLQFHPAYPGSGAVNWGGYGADGSELAGSESDLPSTLSNPNTRNFRWQARRRYRYRVFRSPADGWRATITDEHTGAETVIRDLYVDADHLVNPMVWTEAFCDCAARAVEVRWSNLTVIDGQHHRHQIHRVRTNYQGYDAGGCTNTMSTATGDAFVQRTNTARTSAGTTLDLLGPAQ